MVKQRLVRQEDYNAYILNYLLSDLREHQSLNVVLFQTTANAPTLN
jgi:hypothetical protein